MTQFKYGDRVDVTITKTFTCKVDSDGEVFVPTSEPFGDYMNITGDLDEGVTVEKARSAASQFVVGDVVKNRDFVPFVKISYDKWVPVGGSGMLYNDQRVTEEGWVTSDSQLLGNIRDLKGDK